MPLPASILNKLEKRYSVPLVAGDVFRYSPSEGTVYYAANDDSIDYLIHEMGHALLEHTTYTHDIELLSMERDAWKKAHEIAREIGISLNYQIEEEALDSYRDWLHQRSTCPTCKETGVQGADRDYTCISCGSTWAVTRQQTCRVYRKQIKQRSA